MSVLSTADVRLLASQIAQHMPGWTLEPEKDDDWRACLGHPDGRNLIMRAARESRSDAGKLAISVRLTPEQYKAKYSDETTSSIRVSASRGAVVIAKEIERRLLPEYTALWQALSERVAANNAYTADSVANARAIASLLGVDAKDNNSFSFFEPNGRNFYGDVQVSGSNVEMKLRSLTVKQARAIARLLSENA